MRPHRGAGGRARGSPPSIWRGWPARSGALADRSLRDLAPLVVAMGLALFGEALLNFTLFGLDGFSDLSAVAIVLAPLSVLALRQVRLDRIPPWVGPLSSAIYFVHPLFIFLVVNDDGLPLSSQVTLVLALSALAGGGLVCLSRRLSVI